MLLVLDNCDALHDGGYVIARLLEVCPRLQLLVTSRTGLRVRGEHRLSVRSRGTRRFRQSSDANPVVLRQVAGLTLQPAAVPKDQEHRLFPLTRREQAVARLLAMGTLVLNWALERGLVVVASRGGVYATV